MALKEIVRHYITKPEKSFHPRRTLSPLIFSHMSVEQTRVDKLFLKVYFYDTDVESSYRYLRMACKRIHRNQRRLYYTFLNIHGWFVREHLDEHTHDCRNKLLYRHMSERGFFEYLVLRKIIFLFLCAVFRDKFLRTHRGVLMQIKVGLFSLLEYNWRKNLFYNRPLNFFEFFINVFLQMQFLERNVSPNAVRATMFYIRSRYSKLKKGGGRAMSIREIKELLHLVKWFKFSRMSLAAKLSSNPKVFNHFMANTVKDDFTEEITKNQLSQKKNYDEEYVRLSHKYKRLLIRRRQIRLKRERMRLWRRLRKSKNRARLKAWITPDVGKRKAKLKLYYYYPDLARFKQRSFFQPHRFSKPKSRYLFTEKASFMYLSKMSKLFSWLSKSDLEESTRFVITIRPHTYDRFKKLLQNETPVMQEKI